MRTEKFGLKVDDKLIEFVEAKALPGIDISSDDFWKGLSDLVNKLGPKNLELLQKRKDIKQKIDSWHIDQRGKKFDSNKYKTFLKSIDLNSSHSVSRTIKSAPLQFDLILFL